MRIDYEKALDADQYAAATTKDGTVLILAGAGSGKTRTLTHRVAWLVDQGVSPSEILLLTFTNKAADEMRDRAVSMLDDRCRAITACTYHSFCTRMLRRYGGRIGVPNGFGILSSPDVESTIAVIRARDKKTYQLRGFPQNGVVASMLSVAVNTGRKVSAVIDEWQNGKYAKYANEIIGLLRSYVEYKDEHGLLDYDDLLVKFARLLETDEPTRRRISDTYRYIMVDEYQDTNRLQERILFDLRRDSNNLMVVGDDYQSIYAFRGADINNIIEFPNRVRHCDKIVHIGNNYRSSIEICDFANAVMREHAKFGFPKQMRAKRWGDAQPILVRTKDEAEESDWVWERIQRLHEENGIPYGEIAVLARTGRDTFLLENTLNAQGVAYEKYGGLKFLEYRCVLDAIAFMRVMANPESELPWFRILPLYPGIGERYAYLITQEMSHAPASDPLGFLLDKKWARRKFGSSLRELHDAIARFSETEFDDLPAAIVKYYMNVRKDAIEKGRYDDEANRSEDLEKLAEDGLALDALVRMAGAYKSLREFLDAIILDSLPKTPAQAKAMADDGGKQDMLVLSTIHSIKGLEFSAVFVLDCVEGKFPRRSWGGNDDNDDMEDLRCFYVAITRAKDWLFVCAPKRVRSYNGSERVDVTPFLADVDGDLYEVMDTCPEDGPDCSPWDDWNGFGIPF